MTADSRHRCRWHDDGPAGRCQDTQAFPGSGSVPPFCMRHLGALEPWITARAATCGADAQGWITWARRKAEDTQDTLRALGLRGSADRMQR